MKKKSVVFTLCALLGITLCTPMFSGCTPREEILKVGNLEDYIAIDDESGVNVIQEFEAYYTQMTGKKVKVQYNTFDTNETMLQKVAGSRTDYDVVCTSDYMIEKMKKENLLLKKSELGNDQNGQVIEDYRSQNIAQVYKDRLSYFDPNYEYSVGYMWGSMGILYNEDLLKQIDSTYIVDSNNNGHPDFLESWGAMFDSKYAKYQAKSYMKDSIRDTVGIALVYGLGNEINAGQLTAEQAINATGDEQLKMVKDLLIAQKKNIKGYEVDNGKKEAVDGSIAMTFQWAGDAAWAIAENSKLKYVAPVAEGNNIFFDGWVIPAYAKNTEAANLWLNFMAKQDIAIKNMDYIGYTTLACGQDIIDYIEENNEGGKVMDLSYLYGEAGKAVMANDVQFIDKSNLDKYGMMRDYGDRLQAVINAWTEIKSA